MTQQSHCWAYTPRKPELKETMFMYTPMFITALFIIARTQKQPECPLADEWIRKLWYIHTMEYYSSIKKNAFESILMRWMKLEPIIQKEVSQKEKQQYSILTHIYGIQMSAIVRQFEHSLTLPFFGIGMKTDLFQSCGHC